MLTGTYRFVQRLRLFSKPLMVLQVEEEIVEAAVPYPCETKFFRDATAEDLINQGCMMYPVADQRVSEDKIQPDKKYFNKASEVPCHVIRSHCTHYKCQLDSNGEVVIEYCSHENNPSDYEGNVLIMNCPILKETHL